MVRTLLSFALVVGLAATATAPVSAQEDRAADVDARALFEEGRAAYDAGRFEEATRAFRRAYVLSSRYQLLYNIGQSELRAGHDARALEAFEGFLRQASADAPNRSEVEERVRVLRSMGVTSAAAEAEPTTEPETTTEVEPEPAPVEAAPSADEGPGIAPWIVLGGGAAVLATGVVLMVVGVSEASRVTDPPEGTRWADLEGVGDGANVMWGVGIALAGVGLAASAVGLAWGLTSGPSSGGDASARLRIGPMGLAIEGEF